MTEVGPTAFHDTTSASTQPDLRHYIAIVKARKWWIIGTTALVLAITLLYTFRETPQYTSDTRVLVGPIGSVNQQAATGLTVNLDNESAIAKSTAVAVLVQSALRSHRSPDALVSGLQVTGESNTNILDFEYTDPKPHRALRLSTAFANAYLRFRQQQSTQQMVSQSTGIEANIAHARDKLASITTKLQSTKNPTQQSLLSAQHDTVLARLGVLEQELQNVQPAGSSGQVVQPATLPTSPSSPRKLRNGILGLVLGLALGVCIAFLRERLDDRLRGSKELEKYVRAPVLATVPHVQGWRKREVTHVVSLEEPKGIAAEAYRTLRTNLQFIARRPDFKVVAVISPSLGEGKTTTVANLGVTLALAGQRVTIVSCDLRKPRLHHFFGLDNKVGLSSLLIGQIDLTEALGESQVDGRLHVVASGPVPPNPAELLGSPEMGEVLATLRETNDFVVIDTPPLAVADGLILAPNCDGLVIVADDRKTTRGAAEHARHQLDQAGGKVIGAVLNNFDLSAASYHLGYRYYGYGYQPYEDNTADLAAGNGDANGREPAERSRLLTRRPR